VDLRCKITICDSREQLSVALSAHVAHLAAEAADARGRFLVAISGGSLLDIMAPALGSHPLRDSVDWSRWHVFWADERWVPRSSLESNYGVAVRQLFNRVGIPEEQIHAADDSLSPSETAKAYESDLTAVFRPAAGEVPRFDLILLGVGEDGHTASLFPNHPVLNEVRRWVVPVWDAPKPPPIRITMTLPVINNARKVVIMAAGPGKAKILSKVFNPDVKQAELPVQLVNPSAGELQWFIDRAASQGAYKPFVIDS
jgi:6-phosphogluconolactonase